MWYVYVLMSQRDHHLYVGCTDHLQRRLREHERGDVSSTAPRRPFNLIYYEAYPTREDAFVRKRHLKGGGGRAYLQRVLSHFWSQQSCGVVLKKRD